MEKWTSSFSRRLNKLQSSFASILEAETPKRDPDAPPFEASRDPALVSGLSLGLPDDHVDKAVVIFSRLALCFEHGLLLENMDTRWKARAYFQEGMARPLTQELEHSLALPDMKAVSVLKTEATPLLKKLGVESTLGPLKMPAYVLRPVPDFAYVLFSTLPDLWLKDHLEKVTEAVVRGFAE